MSGNEPDWGGGSRFYLPNEDAAVSCAALALLRYRPRRPVFVGGSGMTLLEAAGTLPRLDSATFVDIAPFQLEYFKLLRRNIEAASSPETLRSWFAKAVYPELRAHYLARGRDYALPRVLTALEENFGVRFLFEPEAFARVRQILDKIAAVRADIGSYLAGEDAAHDFISLSNVPDYLPEAALRALFTACQAHNAPVHLLLTSACPDRDAPRRAWEEAGFTPHAATPHLNKINRGLGSPSLRNSWNRPGSVHLLLPKDKRRRPL